MNTKTLCILALASAMSAGMTAKNYYASPSGTSAGNGSKENPYNFSTALGKLASGDSLFLRGGQYDFTAEVAIKCAGTAKARTFIGAYPGETPVFDFRKEPHDKNGVSLKGDYIHIKGITIRYAGYKGLLNYNSYNVMEQLTAYGNCDSGIQQKGGKSNLILNCDSHDNFDFETGSITAADFGGNADGFADKQYTNSPGNTYIGCRSWHNSDDGWDFYQRVGGTTVFKDCICFQNGPSEYDLSNYPRLTTDADFLSQFAGDGITITNTGGTSLTCSLKHFYNNGNGNGFKLGGNSTKHDASLYRCLSVGNKVKGFDQNSNAGAMTIYNCTAYLNGSNYGFYNNNGYSLDIRNCISHSSKGSNSFSGSSITQSHNTWNSGYTVSDADFVSLDTTIILAPRQADGSLPESTLLHLKSTSKLIDAGQLLDSITYIGTAPDLGCYEYGATTGIAQITATNTFAPTASVFNLQGMYLGQLADFQKDAHSHSIYIVRDGRNIRKIIL